MHRIFLLVSLIVSCSVLQAADQGLHRGLHRVALSATTQSGKVLSLYKESHALLIGVSAYTNWPRLDSIPAELDAVEKALINQDFNVARLDNPKGDELSNGIEAFIKDHGYESENRLLIYFSGHGHSIGNKGYLLPADVPIPGNKDFRRNLVPMSHIMSWARDMDAKHVLFLFDSCFSGSVFKSRNLPDNKQRYIRQVTAEPVRQFITAGSANQMVPATSTFTPAFVDAIKGAGDLNNDGFITGSELGVHLSQLIPRHVDQTPQYGKIKDYELAQGDFVFFKQEIHVNVPADDVSSTSLETTLWKSVESGNTIEEYRAYVNQYPEGTFAGIALARIARLQQPEPSEEVDIEVDREEPLAKITTGNLTIRVEPSDARIRIMNINPKYRDGISLEIGKKYDVLIDKPGYKNIRVGIPLTNTNQTEHFVLEPIARISNTESNSPTLQSFSSSDALSMHQDCESGNATLCANLSYRYREGDGVKKDAALAFKYAEKGCLGGNIDACADSGYFYREGIGVPQDSALAFALSREACDADNIDACNSLAYMYRKGIGVEKDEVKAFALAKSGCDRNSSQACTELGFMYREGVGVKQDLARALVLAEQACSDGSSDGCEEQAYIKKIMR